MLVLCSLNLTLSNAFLIENSKPVQQKKSSVILPTNLLGIPYELTELQQQQKKGGK